MPRLSILIPSVTFDSLAEETLVSVLQNRPEYSEILVVTEQPYSDPYQLGREVRFLTHPAGADALDQINFASQQARGEILHLLLPGTTVLDGWTDQVWPHFQRSQTGSVSPIVMQADFPARIEAVGVHYHERGERRVVGHGGRVEDVSAQSTKWSRLPGLAPSLAAAFYLREAFVALGGFAKEMGESMADVEMGLSLTELGYECVVEPTSQVTTRRAIHRRPSRFSEARQAEMLYRRQHGGKSASPIGHAMLLVQECFANFPGPGMISTLLGHLGGGRPVDLQTSQARRIEQAKQDLARGTDEVATIRMPTRPVSNLRQRLVETSRRRAA